MNDTNMKAINDWIRTHAAEAQSKLPDLPEMHAHGRNAVAHFHTMIQWVWGVKHTKDVSDADFNDVMEVLRLTLKYASSVDIEKHLLEFYTKHHRATTKASTLDDIFLPNG